MTTSDRTRVGNAAGIAFMRTQISVGLAFAELASGTGDHAEKHKRNRANAQKAYEALMKFLPRLSLTDAEAKELYDGAEQVRLAIAAIPVKTFQTDQLSSRLTDEERRDLP